MCEPSQVPHRCGQHRSLDLVPPPRLKGEGSVTGWQRGDTSLGTELAEAVAPQSTMCLIYSVYGNPSQDTNLSIQM